MANMGTAVCFYCEEAFNFDKANARRTCPECGKQILIAMASKKKEGEPDIRIATLPARWAGCQENDRARAVEGG